MAPHASGDGLAPEADAPATDDETGLVRAEAGETEPPVRRRPSAWTLLRRVPLVLARLILDALPIIVFAAAGHFAIETELGGNRLVRLTMLAVVDAYAICRAIFVLARLLLSPRSPHLRLVHVEDATAAYAMRWIKRIVSVAIFGYAAAEVGLMLGMTQAAHSGLLKTVGAGRQCAVGDRRRAEAQARGALDRGRSRRPPACSRHFAVTRRRSGI